MELSKSDFIKLLNYYNKGLHYYRNKDFSNALSYFEECIKINANDGPSRVYIERCKEYIQNPPSDDWDGVFEMKTKWGECVMMLKIPYSIDDFIVRTLMRSDIYAEGEIVFSTSLRIECNFKGNIISENGFVIIGPNSTVIGNITAGTIMVAGKVIGDLVATKKVELFSKSEVIGNIKAPKFRMEDDVKFEGDCDIFYEDEKEVQNG